MNKYTLGGMAGVIVLLCLAAVYFIGTSKQNLYAEKLHYLAEISSKSAALIEAKVSDQLNLIETVATHISNNSSLDMEMEMSLLRAETEKNKFKRMGILSLDGVAITTDGLGFDGSDEAYFKEAMSGKSVVSNSLIDSTDGSDINVFATPLKKNQEIVGVLFAIQSIDAFSNMLTIDSFGSEGYSYIIDRLGRPVIYTNHKNSVGQYDNIFETLQKLTGNTDLIEELKSNLQAGKSGVFTYDRDGISRQVNYTKVGLNDWYIVSVVPVSVLSNSSDSLIRNTVITALAVLICALLLGYLGFRFFKKANNTLKQIAFTDVITGYSNWNKFERDALALLWQNPNKKYAMINFDMDKFKVINDIYGHKKGNEVLQHIANVLKRTTKEDETFGRTSSDNFNLLICYKTTDDIIARIEDINQQVMNNIEGYIIRLSFGIYRITKMNQSINRLSDRANLARLSVKSKADVCYSFFNEEIRNAILVEKEIENCMELALKNGEFEVYLQPKFLFETEKIAGAEALVRWNRPGKGIIPPDQFIPLFEKNGFVRKLDAYMFEQVCVLLSKWKATDKFITPIAISVNFSRVHLNNAVLSTDLLDIAKRHGIDPQWLEIEITESAVFDNMSQLIEVMGQLKEVGFAISIDDFGSGYSSLNILKDIPASIIKMDKAFLDEATDDERGKLIVSSLIKMAKELGLCTVAEGVETLEQVGFLKKSGCDIAQGYYYARPMPVKEFEELRQKQTDQ